MCLTRDKGYRKRQENINNCRGKNRNVKFIAQWRFKICTPYPGREIKKNGIPVIPAAEFLKELFLQVTKRETWTHRELFVFLWAHRKDTCATRKGMGEIH
jgi:hypothetical protein